jgi:AraC-like DNA-binding protein
MKPNALAIAQASHLVGPLLRHLRDCGEDIELESFGLTIEAFERDASPITNLALGRLFDEVARVLDEPNLGLVLPAKLKFQQYAIPELAARASATLRESLEQWARYASLVHPSVVFALDEAGGRARFSHRTLGHPRGVSRHLNEFALAAATYFGRQTTDGGPLVLEAHFVHARPRSLEGLEAFFKTSALFFGADANLLVIDSASLDRAQRTADPRLLATVQSIGAGELRGQKRSWSGVRAQVASQLRAELASGEVRIRKLARSLHMSVRTLQRRLDEEETTFAEVLDEVREELARDLVSALDVPLAEVAQRLGFAEFATFSRAFKRWTGRAPGAFRVGSREPR